MAGVRHAYMRIDLLHASQPVLELTSLLEEFSLLFVGICSLLGFVYELEIDRPMARVRSCNTTIRVLPLEHGSPSSH